MRQQIHELQGCLLAGPEAINKEILPTACSLQEEHVPVSWIHPNCQPSTHSLVSWLEGWFLSHFNDKRNHTIVDL